ncbi:pentatricopeptide repeat-containing protein [Tanacetum coccineum]|uniref:Pentatricopeptide repeat-containing protein n=1 Tax=Tanacetum coccineum TaxID=301880 RepID=A0ABQ4X837_9ASTR
MSITNALDTSGLHLGLPVTLCVNCVGDDVSFHRRNDIVEEERYSHDEDDDDDESESEDAQVVRWASDDVAPLCGSGGCPTSESSDFRCGVKRCRFDDDFDRIDSELLRAVMIEHLRAKCLMKCQRDFVSFNLMIDGGYSGVEDGWKMTWELFEEMPERDLVSWNLMIGCCVKSGKIDLARALFDRMPKRDVITWAKLIDGYAKLGRIEVARRLFDEMPERDVISCNVMMAGDVRNGLCLEALEVFRNMNEGNLVPDDATLSIALSAIAQLGHRDEGVSVHVYINKNGLNLDGKLGVSLVDMYSKSGSIETAIHVFEEIKYKNVDHWNAVIGGLAIHGFGKKAFDMFLDMQRREVKQDSITFVNVLNACAHSGMVKEGIMCFEIMRRYHMVEPEVQHFGCLVDMFAWAGQIKEALGIIEEMPVEPNNVLWRTLLSACNNLEDRIETPKMKHGTKMDYYDSSSYVLLSNIYARFGMWGRVRKVRGIMKECKLKKVPGRSWIELDGTFHEFFVGDGSHPQVAEIYSVLEIGYPLDSRFNPIRLQTKLKPALFPIGSQIDR